MILVSLIFPSLSLPSSQLIFSIERPKMLNWSKFSNFSYGRIVSSNILEELFSDVIVDLKVKSLFRLLISPLYGGGILIYLKTKAPALFILFTFPLLFVFDYYKYSFLTISSECDKLKVLLNFNFWNSIAFDSACSTGLSSEFSKDCYCDFCFLNCFDLSNKYLYWASFLFCKYSRARFCYIGRGGSIWGYEVSLGKVWEKLDFP